MIAHVCACTGWTWDYVAENIDLPRLNHLGEYWKQHPPVHILVAAYMGYKGQDAPKTDETDAAEAISMLGGDTLSEDEFTALLKEKGLM
ncbi:TPA: hypothetical protein ACFP4Q_000835 [Neisseria weaveri]